MQYATDASQKFTWPTVTGVLPANTVAVKVTTLGEATVVTALPPEVTVKVVVVDDAAQAELLPVQRVIDSVASRRPSGLCFTIAKRESLARASRQRKLLQKVFI